MKFERYGIGYDVRPRRNLATRDRLPPHASMGDELYSVDAVVWPSLWLREWRDVPVPSFVGPVQHLWMDLTQLREETSRRALPDRVRWVAIEVLTPETGERLAAWRGRAELIRPSGARDEWTLLGYDVADYYLRSWLRPLASDGELWQQVHAPTDALDQRGLFPGAHLSHALEFVARLNAADTADSGWCAFAIWDLGESPSTALTR